MKTFANDKLKMAQMAEYFLGRVEIIVGRGENADNQFLFFFNNVFCPIKEKWKIA